MHRWDAVNPDHTVLVLTVHDACARSRYGEFVRPINIEGGEDEGQPLSDR
jgi:hypothetical protein